VTFDPSSPYRRKSSMVEASAPRIQKSPSTHCVVHQFLESHRRAQHRQRDEEQLDDTCLPLQHDGLCDDLPAQNGSDRVGDPNGGTGNRLGRRESRMSVIARSSAESSDDHAGQDDEKQWQETMQRTVSELDLISPQTDRESADELRSRMLTKKQLSEMAWDVRQLSRRLGSLRLKFRIKSIFILTKVHDAELIPKTRELARWLLDKERPVRYTVYVEDVLKENKRFDAAGLVDEIRKDYTVSGEAADEEVGRDVHKRLRYWTERMCRTRPHMFDFMITLGGDGTVLYASWLFQRIMPPVMSFALGSLGFLTKFDFEDYRKTLTSSFESGLTVSLRLRFEGTIMRSVKKRKSDLLSKGLSVSSDEDEDDIERRRDLVEELIGEEKDDEHTHRPDGTYEIMNEIVVDRGPNPSRCPCARLPCRARTSQTH
jgi:NAD+ kinase